MNGPGVGQRQRLHATAHVSSKQSTSAQGAPTSAINSLYQQGSARIRFPHQNLNSVQAVLINTAGGLTGDDQLHWKATAGYGSRLCLTTAACEKVYRTHGPVARQHTQLKVCNQARLDWLPQETIAFNGSSLARNLEVQVEANAACLLLESVVFGRQAMREKFDNVYLHDRWRVYRDDRLLHAEDFRIDTRNGVDAQSASIMHHYGAYSTLVLITDQHDEWFEQLKQQIMRLIDHSNNHIRVGVSGLPKRLVVRVLADNSYQLRKFLIPCIELLNDAEPVPSVWCV